MQNVDDIFYNSLTQEQNLDSDSAKVLMEFSTDTESQSQPLNGFFESQPSLDPQSDLFAVPVSSVTLDKRTLTLIVGASEKLIATVNPTTATDKTVTWKSSATKVAIVSNGTVKAISAGNATITATAGGKSATCTVTVNAATQPTGVTINYSTLSLQIAETHTLVATVSPSNASNKKVTWSSDKTNVATVSTTGLVTAIGNGTVTITATTSNGKTATCTVTVGSAGDEFTYKLMLGQLTANYFLMLGKWDQNGNILDIVTLWSDTGGFNTQFVTVNANGTATYRFAEDVRVSRIYDNNKWNNNTLVALYNP